MTESDATFYRRAEITGWTLCALVLVWAGALIWTLFSESRRNPYELAQQKQVLLDLPTGWGSGAVIQRGGRFFIWTVAHVMRGLPETKIKLIIEHEDKVVGFTQFKARVLVVDARLDLALLWLDCPPGYFQSCEFSRELPKVGDRVYHVGNMHGDAFPGSVSDGIVSNISLHPPAPGWIWPVTDQTTATIVPGCSGGPVFDRANKVIGLAVGTAGPGVNAYVPVRVIEAFAAEKNVLWAVRGDTCPDDATLRGLAASVANPH